MHTTIIQLISKFILAGLGGFLLTWLGVWMNWEYLSGDSYTNPLLISRSDTEVSIDSENHVSQYKVHYFNNNNREFYAEKYNKISWEFKPIFSKSDITFFWKSEKTPGITHTRPLAIKELILGFLNLKDDPNWSGPINLFGIKLKEVQSEQINLNTFTLHLPSPNLIETLKILFQAWRTHYPWNWRSIDYHKDASNIIPLSPVPLTVLWILLSTTIFLPTIKRRAKRTIIYGLFTFIIIGWLILDIHWQWELIARGKESYVQYGHRGTGDKATSMDRNILQASKDLLLHLPKSPIRLFIINNKNPDYSKYFAYRLFYYLLPHRASVASPELLDSANLDENDFVFYPVGTIPGILKPKIRKYSDSNDKLSLILHYNLPGAGMLYRVLKGN